MTRHVIRATVLVSLVSIAIPVLAQSPKKPAPKRPARPAAKTAPAPQPPPPPPPPPPDLVVSTQYVSGDRTTKSTLTLHGARERIDYETTLATIQACDTSKTIELNTQTRTYLPSSFPSSDTLPPPAPGEKHKGGDVTFTTSVTDTGEKKQMFGLSARHEKTVIVKTWTPEAWDKRPEHVEIDGWYVDLPPTTTCMGAPPVSTSVRVNPDDATARDVVRFVRPEKSAGFPLAYTMVTTAATDAPVTTTMEVLDVKRVSADAALFDAPADYVEVKTPAQLTADHRPGEDGPKKPGTIRIGVAPVANRSSEQFEDLTEALVESLGDVQKDVVQLHATTPRDLEAEAKTRQCDYVFQATIAQVNKPSRGMMSKLSGGGADDYSAKVEYALVTPGQPKPSIAGSERSGTSLLRKTVTTAERLSQYVLPFVMGTGYLNAFAAISGKTSPLAMQQTQDPVLSSVFALIDRATAPKPEPKLTSGEGAAAMALQRAVDAMAAALKKRFGS